jgi:hypothetical protein
MLRSVTVVLAILLVLDCSGLSGRAFARGGDFAGGGRGDGFRRNHVGGVGGMPGDSYAGYGNRAGGLHGGFGGNGGRDMWGHWGAYYGPMVANPF